MIEVAAMMRNAIDAGDKKEGRLPCPRLGS